MSPALLLFGVGSLLLVTGLLGGGFEMRELRVPKVGRVARVLATGAGALCILLGLGMTTVDPAPGPDDNIAHAAQPTPTPEPPAGPVHFQIVDTLGDNELANKVQIVFDNRRVGDLKVDADDSQAVIEVTAPAPGRYDYTVAVSSEEIAEDYLSSYVRDGAGQGSVEVREGTVLYVDWADSGDRRDVTLVAA